MGIQSIAALPGQSNFQAQIQAEALLQTQGLVKRFPGVVANAGLDLTVQRGEIQTVLGENGAGKTTLINILSGMLQPDGGQIFIRGRETTLPSPQAALRQGLSTVYQHFTLVPNLSVIENIILGQKAGFILNLGQAERRLQSMLGEFGMAITPGTEIRYLSLGQRQRVEIIKALYRGSELLLLDEPTSILAPGEIEELFAILRRLKQNGIGVLFVTHKLQEALSISDRITVLRQGRCAGRFGPQELSPLHQATTAQRIIELMFGGLPSPDNSSPAVAKGAGATALALENVTASDDRGATAIRDISLQLRAGEILGLAGVDGHGQKELAEVIAGQRPAAGGRLLFQGVDITNKSRRAGANLGIGYITDDRLGEGCVPGLSVAENLVLKVINRAPFSRRFLLQRAAIEAHARRLIQMFDIRTLGPWVRAATLSGGNIQKLLLARELAQAPRVLVCNKPTQGLDLKTARFVLRTLRSQAGQGAAVLLFSTELDELLAVSDRLGVMYNGRLVEVMNRDQATPERLGYLMLGGPP